MFHIEDAPNGHESPSKIVVDRDRDAWLRFVSSRGREHGFVFQIAVADKIVPFEVSARSAREGNGDEYFVEAFDGFGYSVRAEIAGIPRARFDSKEERQRIQLLAAEALLVFGSDYDGLSRPDGQYRVQLNGETFFLSSFGYFA